MATQPPLKRQKLSANVPLILQPLDYPTNSSVGITAYTSSDPSLRSIKNGILKHRFSDFLVWEIGTKKKGEVVHLESLDKPIVPVTTKEDDVDKWTFENWEQNLKEAFSEFLDENQIEALRDFVTEGPPQRPPKGTAVDPSTLKHFRSSPMSSKDARTSFHKSVRQCFAGLLASEAERQPVEGEDGLRILVFWKNDPKGKNRLRYPATTHSPYIHFTLHKTNRETHDSLQLLSRVLKVPHQSLNVAGTKDKRAVTVQRVSMELKRARWNGGVEEVWRRVKEAGEKVSRNEVTIGDVEWSSEALELGKGDGNRFCITLRDVQFPSPDSVKRNIEHLSNVGFINYFGLQRFGTSTVPTHRMGLLLLQSKWEEACGLVLDPRTEEEPAEIAVARQIYKSGDISEALQKMPHRAVAERAVLGALEKSPGNWLGALNQIPKGLKTMYVHSYQSYVWNNVASTRIERWGIKPVIGDLVLVEKEEGEGEIEIGAKEIVKSGKKELKMPETKFLTEEDLDKYSIQDIVFPLPGWAVQYPAGAIREVYKEIMEVDSLNIDDMKRSVRDFSLPGSYRYLVQRPKDVKYRLIPYSSPETDLAQSDYDRIRGIPFQEPKEGANWAFQLELSLKNGTYATMALREVMEGETETGSRKMRERTEKMLERMNGAIETEEALVTIPLKNFQR